MKNNCNSSHLDFLITRYSSVLFIRGPQQHLSWLVGYCRMMTTRHGTRRKISSEQQPVTSFQHFVTASGPVRLIANRFFFVCFPVHKGTSITAQIVIGTPGTTLDWMRNNVIGFYKAYCLSLFGYLVEELHA